MLLDPQRLSAQERRDPLSRVTIPVEMVLRIPAVTQVTLDRGDDLPAVIVDIQDVAPPVPPELTGADVDHRNSEERALPNARARIADEAARDVEQTQEVVGRPALVEMEGLRLPCLAKHTEAARGY